MNRNYPILFIALQYLGEGICLAEQQRVERPSAYGSSPNVQPHRPSTSSKRNFRRNSKPFNQPQRGASSSRRSQQNRTKPSTGTSTVANPRKQYQRRKAYRRIAGMANVAIAERFRQKQQREWAAQTSASQTSYPKRYPSRLYQSHNLQNSAAKAAKTSAARASHYRWNRQRSRKSRNTYTQQQQYPFQQSTPHAVQNSRQKTPARTPKTATKGAYYSPYHKPGSTASYRSNGHNSKNVEHWMKKQLKSRFFDKDGIAKKIAVLDPIDYTRRKLINLGKKQIRLTLQRYGAKFVEFSKVRLVGLTLEDLRNASIATDCPIVISTLFKSNAFEMYVYDRAYPYKIFVYSQPLPANQSVNKQVLSYYVRLLTQRTLYQYIRQQNYELPRKDTSPLLAERLPSRIANQGEFDDNNRVMSSNFYLSPGLGITLSRSSAGDLWNSNVLSLNAGFGLNKDVFFELGWDGFNYNAITAMFKYLARSRSSRWVIGTGIGGGILSTSKALNWDQSFASDMAETSGYLVGSLSVLFPLQDLHLKVDAKAFSDVGFSRFIFSLVPGLLLFF